MNELLETRLLTLLSDASQEVTNKEMQSAYGNFIEHVEIFCNSGDKQTVFRILNLTCIELAALESFIRYGQGEKRA
jgi:hypothetical protein